jgi:adenine-specific DNA-methyltransferase
MNQEDKIQEADQSVTREGETLRQDEWREELLRAGIRGKNNQKIRFSRIEPMKGTKYIHAEGETKWTDEGADSVAEPDPNWKPKKVLIVFGPEHAPLEQRQVELAIEEARMFKPDILLFCAFQFEEEAAKDIDNMPQSALNFQLLKAQMNMDLQTEDLKKKRSSNESFWLMGQPDISIVSVNKKEVKVEVHGFDYYNPKTGDVESGSKNNIAMWMLDTDYDNRSLFPDQVFLPMAGDKDGWNKLAKNLKAEIDEEKIEAFHGTESLPFEPGKQVAVKIIDDRGIESLKVMDSDNGT